MRPRTTWPASTSANGASTAVRHPVGERARLERLDQLLEVGVVVDVGVGAARAGRRGRAGAAGRSGSRPRRGSGCRTGPPARAAAASAGPGRPAKTSGSSRSRASAVADRLDGRGTSTAGDRSRRRLLEEPGELVVPVLDAAEHQHVVGLVGPRPAGRQRLRGLVDQRRRRVPTLHLGGVVRHRPREVGVERGVGVGGVLVGLVAPGVGRRAPARQRLDAWQRGRPTGRDRP